jgi:hypothetical protein
MNRFEESDNILIYIFLLKIAVVKDVRDFLNAQYGKIYRMRVVKKEIV